MDWRVLGMSLGFNIWRCSFFLFWSFIFCSIFLFLCRFLKMENRWQELHPLQKWEVTEVCPDWPWECKQMRVREVRFCFSSQMNVWYYRYNTKPVRGRSCTATSSTVLNWWLEKVTTTFILSEQRLILLNHCHHHNFTFFFFTDWTITTDTTWILEWRCICLQVCTSTLSSMREAWGVWSLRRLLHDRKKNESTITTKKIINKPKRGKRPLRKMKMMTHSQDE